MRLLILALRIRALEAFADGLQQLHTYGVGDPLKLASTVATITMLKAAYRRECRGSGLQPRRST